MKLSPGEPKSRMLPGNGCASHGWRRERRDDPRKTIGQQRKAVGKRIACQFDDVTFARIRAQAMAANTSFAEQVRILVEWGLEAK